jgi:hypothetical protein
MNMERHIPESRLGRLMHLGRPAGGIAGCALSEGAGRLGQGRRPSLGDLLLPPAKSPASGGPPVANTGSCVLRRATGLPSFGLEQLVSTALCSNRT